MIYVGGKRKVSRKVTSITLKELVDVLDQSRPQESIPAVNRVVMAMENGCLERVVRSEYGHRNKSSEVLQGRMMRGMNTEFDSFSALDQDV